MTGNSFFIAIIMLRRIAFVASFLGQLFIAQLISVPLMESGPHPFAHQLVDQEVCIWIKQLFKRDWITNKYVNVLNIPPTKCALFFGIKNSCWIRGDQLFAGQAWKLFSMNMFFPLRSKPQLFGMFLPRFSTYWRVGGRKGSKYENKSVLIKNTILTVSWELRA